MATNAPQGLKIVSVILMLFGVFPLLVGLGLLTGAGFTANRQYHIVEKWPSVDAQVTRSELAHHQTTFGKNNTPTTVYEARIDFRYSLGGKQYTTPTGSNYSTSNFADMKLRVDTFAPGTHHQIRYNPANPNDIRYDAGFTFGFFITPLILGGMGLVFTLIGAVVFYLGLAIGRAKVRCPSCGATFRSSQPSCPNCGAALSPSGAGR